MDLREYLFRNKMTVKKLSEELMVNSNYLGGIVRGEKKPSKRLARDIEIYTNHQVKADYILETENYKKKEDSKTNHK